MRDYTKALTLVLTGTGNSTSANTTALLEDFIFGNLPADAQVDVKFVVPYTGNTRPGLVTAIKIMKDWGIDGKDFLPIVEPNSGHASLASADKAVQVDQGDALQAAIDTLHEDFDAGHDVAFISLYDPNSSKDLSEIIDAKENDWLTTLNLCEGLIDSFEGYESTDDRIKREALEEAFQEQQKAKEVAEQATSPAPVKKAATPRKRAAKNAVAPVDVPLTEEPQKPVQHVHKYVWVDDNKGMCGSFCECGQEEPDKPLTGTQKLVARAIQREVDKKNARTVELAGTIVLGTETPKTTPLAADLVPAADVWKDVANAIPKDITTFAVAKGDIVELGEAMEEMATAFGKAIRVYKNIVEGK